jgi:hypothetical protein
LAHELRVVIKSMLGYLRAEGAALDTEPKYENLCASLGFPGCLGWP